MIFFVFLCFSLSICDYTVNAEKDPSTRIFNVKAGANICINSTSFPFYLVLSQISFKNDIFFYRTMKSGCSPSLDYISTASAMPLAIRIPAVGASYTINAKSGGSAYISAFTSDVCSEGIELTTAATRKIEFSSRNSDDFYNITSGKTRCLFVSDTENFTLQGNLNIPKGDKVCVNINSIEKCYTEKQSFTEQFDAKEPTSALLKITMNGQSNNRKLDIGLEANTESKSIIYGPDAYDPIHPEPDPIPVVHKVRRVSSWALALLIISCIVFIALLVFALLRYGWCNCCFGEFCIAERESKVIKTPRMPSEFIKTPQ